MMKYITKCSDTKAECGLIIKEMHVVNTASNKGL